METAFYNIVINIITILMSLVVMVIIQIAKAIERLSHAHPLINKTFNNSPQNICMLQVISKN